MNSKIFVSLIVVITGLFVYTSCTKIDTTDLGDSLIPVVDNVHTFDTVLDVITDNFLFNDTTRMYGNQPVAIGLMNDPEFGKTLSSVYFYVRPVTFGTHPFINKDSVKIDSVVLSLAYTNVYGDTFSMERFEVFEIDPNSAFRDSNYRISEPEFPVAPASIGRKDVDFNTLGDSVMYVNVKDTIRTKNELRIPIDTAWARTLVNYDTAAQYKTDSAFKVAFKGLAIKASEASALKNGLAYFNLGGANTKLTFYCRVVNNGKTDTIAPSFVVSGQYPANFVRREPNNGFLTYLNNGHGDNDNLVYLQSSPGSYVTIRVPGLDNLNNRTIHRAELILEKVPTALDNIFSQPPVLFIDAVNAAADSAFSIRGDFTLSNSGMGYDLASLEGIYKSNENRYTFNLSRYVQSIVSKQKRNHILRVSAPFLARPHIEYLDGTVVALPAGYEGFYINSPVAAGRVVLGGGSHPTQKMRLRIIYSKI